MKQITIHIPDKKVPFFMELIKSLKFIKKVETEEETSKEQILKDLKSAVEEVNQIKAGKKKAQPLSEFLDEL
ncbi:hypothetical protein C900_00857 [Fulvivirga imtechensis AK7]|uniref:Uncharacterized protein n=1 Tax=Fulvivirga imtechensis AK7 TaxID=1237149 RepID=L8JV51_9BACT|nr:hypothetical protein [Fulvivirga imtechensis]ELR72896.1 hypothetical protein C900_00857 [Fulvivirga imtechensis AK7]